MPIAIKWFVGLVLTLQVGERVQPPARPIESAPSQEWDARFQRSDGWIGGDGAYSVSLTADSTVWLFSDSFVGKVREGKRLDATMVNNAVAIQRGHGSAATVEFIESIGADGKPTALFHPPDDRGWFWINDGICLNGKLYLFLPQIEKKPGETGAFAFRQVGQWVGVVDNPLDKPEKWRTHFSAMPCFDKSASRNIILGVAVARDDRFVYVYGIDERVEKPLPDKRMILARVPLESIEDFRSWRYYRNGEWQRDFREATPLANGMANEFSISYQSGAKRYLAVYTDHGLSDRIMARASEHPWGPWSEPTLLFTCPEMKRDAKLFCYAAKAHAMETGDDEILLTYVVNSSDFWHVFRDASLYWPRFVRVKFPATGRTP